MNLNRYCSTKALCPYYKCHDSLTIYCEGESICSILKLDYYRHKDRRRYHMKRYCEDDYDSCRIFNALNET